MTHESVRKAYDHFQLMCELAKEKHEWPCAMMTTVKDLFDLHIGEDGRKQMFKDFV
jgi:hypothetical protein